MDKSADAFRTISEVAEDLGIPKHVLRFWEVKFTQIRPMKRGGGRRYYRPEDMELLRGVRHLLHRDGYTIKGVQKILREQGIEIVKQLGRGEATVAPPLTGRDTEQRETGPASVPAVRSGLGRHGRVRPAMLPGTEKSRGSAPPDPEPDRRAVIRAAIASLEECQARLRGGAMAKPSRTRRATHG